MENSFIRNNLQTKTDNDLLQPIIHKIDNNEHFRGAGIGFVGGDSCSIIRRAENSRVYVTIEIKRLDKKQFEALNKPAVEKRLPEYSKWSAAYYEAGFDCTFAALAIAGVVTSAAAVPATGGASSFVTAALWTSAVTGSMQCINSLTRMHYEMTDPSVNDRLDQNIFYILAKDTVELGSTLSGGYLMIKSVARTGLEYKAKKTSSELLLDNLKSSYNNGGKARNKAAKNYVEAWVSKGNKVPNNFSKRVSSKKTGRLSKEIYAPVLRHASKEDVKILVNGVMDIASEIIPPTMEIGKTLIDEKSYIRRIFSAIQAKTEEPVLWINISIVEF
jgi:hypothetical protein